MGSIDSEAHRMSRARALETSARRTIKSALQFNPSVRIPVRIGPFDYEIEIRRDPVGPSEIVMWRNGHVVARFGRLPCSDP